MVKISLGAYTTSYSAWCFHDGPHNAKNNETAMRHLQLSIPTLNDEDRVFCAGNLVVKAMLFVKPRSLKKTSLALAIPKPFNSGDAGALFYQEGS